MSDSVWCYRRQPTRLPRPWDSPGKNTGVGCHFLLQCMKVKSESEVTQSCLTLCDPKDCSLPGSSIHGIFQARVLEWGAIAFSVTNRLGDSKLGKHAQQEGPVVKNPSANPGNIRDAGLTPGSGRSPGGGHGHPLQYSCPENPHERGAWRATVHRVAKSCTYLKWLSTHTHYRTLP